MRHHSLSLALVLLLAGPALAQDSPDQLAARIGPLVDDHSAQALDDLAQLSDIDRFETLRVLDRTNSTTVRQLYNKLDSAGRARLLDLVQKSGAAGTKAGAQELGVISDVDDTAVPSQYTPDGAYAFKDSPAFYNLLSRGTDGSGDPANLHFVSARSPALWEDTKIRLKAAGVPLGTFDGDEDTARFLFGGLDGIQKSKIEDIDLWLKLHPGQRFVFLGDSLQRDPEVYEWVVQNHPDQVEAVMIHRAGGPARDPAKYGGETFFDTYADAIKIVNDRGIPQPGAKLADHGAEDASGLPLPDTKPDVKKSGNFFTKIGDFFKENIGSIFHHPKKAAPVAEAPSRTEGMTNLLQQRVQESGAQDKAGER